jgi:TPR repeat protein
LLFEERILSQEAALEAVRATDILELKDSVAAIQSALSERLWECEVDLAAEVTDLRYALAAVERENARLASELAGVAIDVSPVQERQESEASQQRDLQMRTQEEVSRLEEELGQFAEKSQQKDGQLTQDITDLREAQAQSHALLQNKVESQRDSIGREVSRLSRACGEIGAKNDRLGRLFDGEQLYRRGCEALYGTNGYDEQGQEKSFRLGLLQVKTAADLGHGDAQYVYGRCLYVGTAGEKDFAEAAKYFGLSAEQQNSYGETRYGEILRLGEGVGKNLPKAVEFYRRSSEQRNALGQAWLGFMLWNEIGTAKDDVRGAELARLSAEQGNSLGQNDYGWALQKGLGVAKDEVQATKYYKLSADQGNFYGQNNYGLCLREGIDVPKDAKLAVYYFKLAADQGLREAQFNYGWCLETGDGVAKDLRLAAEYYKKAADQGRIDAKAAYERVQKQLLNA